LVVFSKKAECVCAGWIDLRGYSSFNLKRSRPNCWLRQRSSDRRAPQRHWVLAALA